MCLKFQTHKHTHTHTHAHRKLTVEVLSTSCQMIKTILKRVRLEWVENKEQRTERRKHDENAFKICEIVDECIAGKTTNAMDQKQISEAHTHFRTLAHGTNQCTNTIQFKMKFEKI